MLRPKVVQRLLTWERLAGLRQGHWWRWPIGWRHVSEHRRLHQRCGRRRARLQRRLLCSSSRGQRPCLGRWRLLLCCRVGRRPICLPGWTGRRRLRGFGRRRSLLRRRLLACCRVSIRRRGLRRRCRLLLCWRRACCRQRRLGGQMWGRLQRHWLGRRAAWPLLRHGGRRRPTRLRRRCHPGRDRRRWSLRRVSGSIASCRRHGAQLPSLRTCWRRRRC